ncbi:MAG: LCP family protein [Lachnospiraceae bacterium]|nr:LCP family protein [Lachnospiraceae bacterium]
MRTRHKIIRWIFLIAELITSALLVITIIRSKFFPVKYTGLALLILAAIWVLDLVLTRKHHHHKISYWTGIALALIISILSGLAFHYLQTTVNTAKKITNAKTESTVYGVYVLKDNKAQSIGETKNYNFGISKTDDSKKLNQVFLRIAKEQGIDKDQGAAELSASNSYDDLLSMATGLLHKESDAIVMNEAFLPAISEVDEYKDFKSQIREIKSYDIKTEVQLADQGQKAADGVFTIFISGIDTPGAVSKTSRSDVNILATVNTKTHQIFLLTTPRDYYVPLSISNGVKDKLTHAGIYGVNVSMDTLSMLYDTKIDYYFRLNFTGFTNIIQALGGVRVHSDYDFQAGGYTFVKGDNYLNSDEALAFARERHAFPQGDVQRGKDQMYVIEGVINKLSSAAVLKNFDQLMTSLSDSFETSIPYDTISSLVSDQLNDGKSWDIQKYHVEGSGAKNTTYSMPHFQAYVMIPDQNSVNQAKEYLDQIEKDQRIQVEQKD